MRIQFNEFVRKKRKVIRLGKDYCRYRILRVSGFVQQRFQPDKTALFHLQILHVIWRFRRLNQALEIAGFQRPPIFAGFLWEKRQCLWKKKRGRCIW